MIPEKLYKYVPSKYVEDVFGKGELLFRNLAYFSQYEDERRGDPLEAHHRDNPDNDIKITNLSTRTEIKGDFSFLNTTDPNPIYAFCMSKDHRTELYKEFQSEACIEVADVEKFLLRIKVKLKHYVSCHESGLLHGDVKYYAANRPAGFNITNATELVFAKDEKFGKQNEYRIVFGTKEAFKLVQKIVINRLYDFKGEAMQGTPDEKLIRIGDISDIARVHYVSS